MGYPSKVMPVIVWGDEHATGIAEIDQQHVHLMELLNAVYQAGTTGAGAGTIDLVLGLVTRYLSVHFAAEERLMKEIDYPSLAEHSNNHALCVRQVEHLVNEYREGRTDLDTVLRFVYEWLRTHTLVSDGELVKFTRVTASGRAAGPA